MNQSLHVLIVDRERGTALVTRHCGRWLLPIVRSPERLRAGPLVLQWMADRGLRGRVVGQWVGRHSENGDSMDWLIVVDGVADDTAAVETPLCRLPIESLTRT